MLRAAIPPAPPVGLHIIEDYIPRPSPAVHTTSMRHFTAEEFCKLADDATQAMNDAGSESERTTAAARRIVELAMYKFCPPPGSIPLARAGK